MLLTVLKLIKTLDVSHFAVTESRVMHWSHRHHGTVLLQFKPHFVKNIIQMSSNLHRNKARDTSTMFSPCLNESSKSHMMLALLASIIAMLAWVWRNSVWTCSLEPPAAKRLQLFRHWSCPDVNDRHASSIFCVAPGCYSVLKALTEIITVIIFEITHWTGRQIFNNELLLECEQFRETSSSITPRCFCLCLLL